MLKKELLKKIADETQLSAAAVERVLTCLQSTVIDELKTSGKSEIHGIGVFKTKLLAERQGRNPSTGDAITIPERTKVSVKATAIQNAVTK